MLCQVNPKVIPIGPLLLPSDFPTPNDTVIADHESEESASLMQWLDTQPPRSVLYIAFGTLVENSKEQMEELAHALEAISDQSFLWSAGSLLRRPNAPQPPTLAKLLPPGQDMSSCTPMDCLTGRSQRPKLRNYEFL
jgi:hypothetical protein